MLPIFTVCEVLGDAMRELFFVEFPGPPRKGIPAALSSPFLQCFVGDHTMATPSLCECANVGERNPTDLFQPPLKCNYTLMSIGFHNFVKVIGPL